MSSRDDGRTLTLRIMRKKGPEDKGFWQDICFNVLDSEMTVASALTAINAAVDTECAYKDSEGRKVEFIRWESSCLQKKCGACAMVIDGRPCLACDTKLEPFLAGKGVVTIEPLRKFPLVADLMVDRSRLQENLREMKVWPNGDMTVSDKNNKVSYDSSLCIQCGCCLEVCPNFDFSSSFFGAAAFVPATREMVNSEPSDRKEMRKSYSKNIYNGCGKSLSCKDICPRKIDTQSLLVRSNAVLLWGKRG